MANGRIHGRGLWNESQASDPLVDLLVATVKRAQRDVEEAKRKGELATPAQIAARQSAESFLEECRQSFT